MKCHRCIIVFLHFLKPKWTLTKSSLTLRTQIFRALFHFWFGVSFFCGRGFLYLIHRHSLRSVRLHQRRCIWVWKLRGTVVPHGCVCDTEEFHCFSFTYGLLHYLSPLILITFQSQSSCYSKWKIFPLFPAKLLLFYNEESVLRALSQTWWIWRGIPWLLQGVGFSQLLWLWLKMNVLNRGSSRQLRRRWLAQRLCLLLSPSLLLSSSVPRFYSPIYHLSPAWLLPFTFTFIPCG